MGVYRTLSSSTKGGRERLNAEGRKQCEHTCPCVLMESISFGDLDSRLQPIRRYYRHAELHINCTELQARKFSEIRIRLRSDKLRMLMLAGLAGTVLLVRVVLTMGAVTRRSNAHRCGTHCIALRACEQCGNNDQGHSLERPAEHPQFRNSTRVTADLPLSVAMELETHPSHGAPITRRNAAVGPTILNSDGSGGRYLRYQIDRSTEQKANSARELCLRLDFIILRSVKNAPNMHA